MDAIMNKMDAMKQEVRRTEKNRQEVRETIF